MFDETLAKVANDLIDFGNRDEAVEGLKALYAEDAVSVEAGDMGMGRESNGVAAIIAKHEAWNAMVEAHSSKITGPFFHGDNQFGLIFELDSTNRQTGERSEMRELGIYTVKDGKITREEFFYSA
ncbi:MAG: SnoaL-like domain-containing protein [Pseudomonadota bacterium]